ncbi:hypothetical protein GQ457_03G021860 [Hibiscus cannabinus]
MEDENDFLIRGRQGIKPSQIPSLMGFDEDATTSAPPSGARTIAAARMAELMTLTERTQDQLRDMQEKMTSLFHYMRERDEAIQSYFLELLPDEVPLFPVFPSELFHAAQPAKRKAPQDQAAPQPPLKKKKVPSTSTATPPVRPSAPEEREEPATPHADTAASVPKPPTKTATASKRTLTRKDKGKAPVRASPRAPAPEATVELDSDDDHDDDMPDTPPPPAPPMEPTIPRRRIKRKANRNISTADLAAEENVASEAEDDGSSTTLEETPNPNPPSSKARYKHVAIKQTPNLIACEGLVLLEKGAIGGVLQVKQLQGLRRKRCCSIQGRMMSTKILQHWKNGVFESPEDLQRKGRLGITYESIPSLMGFDEVAISKQPTRGAKTIAAAKLAALTSMAETTRDQLEELKTDVRIYFKYVQERDQVIKANFNEMLPQSSFDFPPFPQDLLKPAKAKMPEPQPAQPPTEHTSNQPQEKPLGSDSASSSPTPLVATPQHNSPLRQSKKGKEPINTPATLAVEIDNEETSTFEEEEEPERTRTPPVAPTPVRRQATKRTAGCVLVEDSEEEVKSGAGDEDQPTIIPPTHPTSIKRKATKTARRATNK